MSICKDYEKYFIDRQTYSNLDFRAEINRYIRQNHPKGFNQFCWVVASMLDRSITIMSIRIYQKNRHYDPGLTLLDVYHSYLEEVVRVLLNSPNNYLKIFEFTKDIKNFENICGDILKKIHANKVRKSIRYSEKTKKHIEFDYFERFNNSHEGKKLGYKRLLESPDYSEKIHKKLIRKNVIHCIHSMKNENRRKVLRKFIIGRTTEQISISLNMPHNTIYSHIHKGKREIKNFLEKSSLLG